MTRGRKIEKTPSDFDLVSCQSWLPSHTFSRAINLEIRTPKLQNPAQGFLPPTLTTG
jgi:hypothetical protein